MADPLLTSLCTICRAAAPKYKCPRCAARTCSAACVARHKARAGCSGTRDATAFLPRARLRTPAGVDHDYNFLAAIERARQRAERELVEERGLLRPEELVPDNNSGRGRDGGGGRFERVWVGDELHHRLRDERGGWRGDWRGGGGRGGGRGRGRGGARYGSRGGDGGVSAAGHVDRHIRRRLASLDIQVLRMPAGMSRQQENKTTWNRGNRVVNWQVEWLIFGDVAELGSSSSSSSGNLEEPVRITHKILDSVPLYQALAESLQAEQRRLQKDFGEGQDGDEPPAKRKKTAVRKNTSLRGWAQQWTTSQWLPTVAVRQDPYSGRWSWQAETAAFPSLIQDNYSEQRQYQFYLEKPRAAPGEFRMLIPLDPGDTLGLALAGRTVLEYPSLIVLPPSSCLPHGFVKGSTDRRERRSAPVQRSEHMTDRPERGNHRPNFRPSGRQVLIKTGGSDDLEEGEIGSEDGIGPEDVEMKSASSESFSNSDDDEAPDEETAAPRMGLVDYDSSSGSSSTSTSDADSENESGIDKSGRPLSSLATAG